MLGANPIVDWIIVNWILLMLFVFVGGSVLALLIMLLRGS
jgi:hypothetical protein